VASWRRTRKASRGRGAVSIILLLHRWVGQVSNSKGPDVISDKLHYDPDEVYQKNMSPFESVVIAAQEARFINEQARLGFLDLKGVKPTTVALDRLREGKVKVTVEE